MTTNTKTRTLGRAAARHSANGYTKSQCHCGRTMCSDLRKVQRRTQRRIERQAFRAELRG
ncbi:hypothetical protein SEA_SCOOBYDOOBYDOO_63 [Mycobacterium phage ScoobyDoobyDoo]|nr:hypothetical protein SEA_SCOOBYDOOBYDOO_63 [Mycobacterium phage ScoobyDoobyDoo]